MRARFALVAFFIGTGVLHSQQRSATVQIAFAKKTGTLDPGRISLGQGGLSEEPMWDTRASEIRALHPKLVRLFIQEYFDLLPARGKYHFDTLDRSVDLIVKAGSKPLMNIDFKPRLLYPKIDQDTVEPNSWKDWEDLIYALVQHYRQRGAGIQYWEIANEPDIGESGGCPYRFTPENYLPYYQHTASAIIRADPNARVGGPALANYKSAILPALIDFGAEGKAPVHFVSWHIYSSEPARVRETINHVNELLAKKPSFKPETILDEWNMSLSNPVQDPGFQPSYIAETAYQMLDAGLSYSCYYHIRDYYVNVDKFSSFMSAQGAAFMGRWWNRMPQFDGLFDYQDTVRPAYYAFKLLSRMNGDRLALQSSDPAVHGFFTYDPLYLTYNLMLWNFSPTPVHVTISGSDVPKSVLMRPEILDARAPSYDENARLRPLTPENVEAGPLKLGLDLEPWGVAFWCFEPKEHN
jgi:xylan 1,4-beta-xylosidase